MAAITPSGPGLFLLLVSTILLSLSAITVGLRMYVRGTHKTTGMDDWLMVVGLVFFLVACQATISAVYNGVGSRDGTFDSEQEKRGLMWFMFFQLFYVLSTVPIKSSICVTLLRITPQIIYRNILFAVIFLSTVACITTDVAVLTVCKPVSATWDKSKGECADPHIITSISFFISAVSILTDWTCAILPAFILWDVNLRLKIKLSVAIILGLGIIASTATIVRLNYLLAYNDPSSDYLYNIAHIAIWSITESGLGLIAGSMATLRPLLRHIPFLSQYSNPKSTKDTKPQGRNGESHRLQTFHYSKSGTHQCDTIIEGGDHEWDRLSDAESQKHIVQNDGARDSIKGITVTTAMTQTSLSSLPPKDLADDSSDKISERQRRPHDATL